MHRLSRRAWLGWCAAAAAGAGIGARAACEAPPPAPDARRPTVAFLDDRERPQGPRLEELRQRLAAHGLGEERLRLATLALLPGEVRCTVEALHPLRPLALCTASAAIAQAALPAAGEIPLLFALHADPVALGIVERLGARGGNATGFTFDPGGAPALKPYELLADAFPGTRRVLVLADETWARQPGRAAQLLRVRERLRLEVSVAGNAREAELQRLAAAHGAAYVPASDLLLHGAPELVAALARARVPHIAGDERLLRHGAMLTFAPRRFAHWDAIAAMLRALAAGTPARELAVQWPLERLLSVSLAPWQRMGLAPAPRLLRRAHVIL